VRTPTGISIGAAIRATMSAQMRKTAPPSTADEQALERGHHQADESDRSGRRDQYAGDDEGEQDEQTSVLDTSGVRVVVDGDDLGLVRDDLLPGDVVEVGEDVLATGQPDQFGTEAVAARGDRGPVAAVADEDRYFGSRSTLPAASPTRPLRTATSWPARSGPPKILPMESPLIPSP
jgi:hypothetical protein